MNHTIAAQESDDYTIVTYRDEQLLTWNAKLVPDYPNYYITECGRVFSTNIQEFLKPTLKTGYLSVVLSNTQQSKRICIHRLVALAYHGFPGSNYQVDHIDREKLNNRVENLRWVTRQQNCFNRSKAANTSSQYMGVSAYRNRGFSSAIKLNGKRTPLGIFPTELEAHQAYLKAKEQLHTY